MESGSLSTRPFWSVERVPGHPELHRDTLSWKTNKHRALPFNWNMSNNLPK